MVRVGWRSEERRGNGRDRGWRSEAQEGMRKGIEEGGSMREGERMSVHLGEVHFGPMFQWEGTTVG